MKRVMCATLGGIDAFGVDVEATLTKGLPSFNIVGLANQSISESKERVKSALLTSGFSFPPKRITINLSPSDLKKEGSHFDLAIALLIALHNDNVSLERYIIFGELGLDGSVKENASLFALMLSLSQQRLIEHAIVPKESLKTLQTIPGVKLYGVAHLGEATAFLRGERDIAPHQSEALPYEALHVKQQAYYFWQEYPQDFLQVRGQEVAKRAALIAASGMHNILYEGSPGSGKSMISKRLRHILPPLDLESLLGVAKLQSLEGKRPDFIPLRPFRSPHHTSTAASIFGGGSHKAQIGEVGLSDGGILFFDELPHFSKNVLEALREPLEDRRIRISRVNAKTEYPTRFMFIAAMNPCPCGNLLHPTLECRCSDLEIQRYKNRLSEPFLDRIDLYVQMQSAGENDAPSVDSKSLHVKVINAFKRQILRSQERLNGMLEEEEIERFCILDEEAQTTLQQATSRFSLSQRSIKKIQKVARSIADLDESDIIAKRHVLEALSYRRR